MITIVTLKLTHIIHPSTIEEYEDTLQHLQEKGIYVYENQNKDNVTHMRTKNYWKQYVEDMKKPMFIICFEYNGKIWCAAHPSRTGYATAAEAAEAFKKNQDYKFEVLTTCEIKESNELYSIVIMTVLDSSGKIYKEIHSLREFTDFFKAFKGTDYQIIKNGESYDLDYLNGIDFYFDILDL